jgi:predicted HTH domain antitoxin
MEVKCEIMLPEQVLRSLGYRKEDAGQHLKRELAVYFFEKNVLGFGQARQLAALSVWDFLELLRERRIPLHYDIVEYEEDSETITRLA